MSLPLAGAAQDTATRYHTRPRTTAPASHRHRTGQQYPVDHQEWTVPACATWATTMVTTGWSPSAPCSCTPCTGCADVLREQIDGATDLCVGVRVGDRQ